MQQTVSASLTLTLTLTLTQHSPTSQHLDLPVQALQLLQMPLNKEPFGTKDRLRKRKLIARSSLQLGLG